MPTLIEELRDYWCERIRRDLSPFADPGTQLDLIWEGQSLTARWTFRDGACDARFAVSLDAGVRVSFRQRTLTYRSFLSCSELGDVTLLAKMMLQSMPPELYIPTKARRADQERTSARPAVELMQELLEEPNELGVTRLLFATGEPGAGKTRVLQELVRRQAQRYLERRSDHLYLYVNAQGRALARFHEALAVELNDLRATLPHHAVASLVRADVLVPIIDGFDELLGVSGYDDAFSSLAGFMEELNGLGQIVASARSTYYEQEFASRAGSVSSLGAQSWSLTPIEILGWGDEEFDRYVDEAPKGENRLNLGDQLRHVFSGRNRDLKKKPLFVVRAADLLLSGNQLAAGSDLLEELVSAYLERERTQKLLDRNSTPILTASQITTLLSALAEEMWNSETRELDQRFVREIAEYVLSAEEVPPGVGEIVKQRLPSFAFLRRVESTGRLAFEHEMFFAYFVARVFIDRMGRGVGALRLLLSRSVLPVDVAALALGEMLRQETDLAEVALDEVMDKLGRASVIDGPRVGQVRENAGILIATGLKEMCGRRGELSAKRVRNVTFPGGDLVGVRLRDSILEGLEFRRVDLSRTWFVECRSLGSYFLDVVVDPAHTRLELAGLEPASQVQGLRRRIGDAAEPIYDPVEVHEALAACGAVAPLPASPRNIRVVDKRIVGLLERLVRAYRRGNPVCKADDNLRQLFQDGRWQDVEGILIRAEIVSKETRATGGPRKEFLRRRVLPEDIMAGANRDNEVPPQVRHLWDELEARFGQKG